MKKGEKMPDWLKERLRNLNLGKKQSKETIDKRREKLIGNKFRLGKSPWNKGKKGVIWKCRINNNDCCGRLEAHHILRWSEFPELRYVINNRITLCHFHHTKKKKNEKELISYFQSIIAS